jgi:molybdopterin-guanine dinucleotide biosynthesis protein A
MGSPAPVDPPRAAAPIAASGYSAIVLAGGAARRLDGSDKAAIMIGGHSLLERTLMALADADPIVVVGPRCATNPPQLSERVIWCRESPPGGGPTAAIAAGVRHAGAPLVAVLAVDQPWIAPAIPLLIAELARSAATDVAALAGSGSRVHYLAAIWRCTALATAIAGLERVEMTPVRALFASVRIALVPDAGDWAADCDTPDDVESSRRRLAEHRPLDANGSER